MLSQKKIGYLCFIILICPVVFIATGTPIHANNLYGTQSLKPMVRGYEMAIYLLGGTKLTTESDQTKYALTDHLQSTRLVVAGNNTASKPTDYTPFGDKPANTNTETAEVGQYTGMTFEPETATHDYHARYYDPTVARFTSPDSIRQSISPYSYVSNNPINKIDPDGRGEISLLLFSKFGTDVPAGKLGFANKKMMEGAVNLRERIPNFKPEITYLEHDTPIDIKSADVTNLTIFAHGSKQGGKIILFSNRDTQWTSLPGEDFATYLHGKLSARSPTAVDQIKSICLMVCGSDYHGQSGESSFAQEFADNAVRLFPKLEEVHTSPYVSWPKQKDLTVSIGVSHVEEFVNPSIIAEYDVQATDYFNGKLPSKLYQPPDWWYVDRALKPEERGGRRMLVPAEDNFSKLTEPTFRKITVREPLRISWGKWFKSWF